MRLASADRAAAVLCGAGAILVLVSTFLEWYPLGVEAAYFDRSTGDPAFAGAVDSWINAWQAFTVVDVLLAAIALAGVVAAVVLLRGRARRAAGADALAIGAGGLALVLLQVVDGPFEGAGIGPVIAACALLTIAFGGALALAQR